MKWGNFFFLDTKVGNSKNEMPVFRYIRLELNNEIQEKYIRYPITVTFTENVVIFLYHQHLFQSYGNQGRKKITDFSIELFKLDFHEHDDESLASTLFDIFNSSEIENRILETPDINLPLFKKVDKENSPCCYSNLDIFLDKPDETRFYYRQTAAIKNLTRKLILDFLFDLYHSAVFEHSQYFNELKASIEQSFLMQAILAKAEFYYYASFIEELFSHKSLNRTNKLLEYYHERFIQTKYNWSKIIRSLEAVESFRLNSSWFRSPPSKGLEEEMNQMEVTSRKLVYILDTTKNKKSKELSSKNSYFVELDRQITTYNYKWYLRRYNIKQATRTLSKRSPLLVLIIILLSSALVSLTISYLFTNNWIPFSRDGSFSVLSSSLNLISLFVIFSIFVFASISFISNRGFFNLLVPRALFTMLPTIFFSLFALDSYSLFWNISILESLVLTGLVVLLLLVFISNEARSMAPDIGRFALICRSSMVILIIVLFSIGINYYPHVKYIQNMNGYSEVINEYANSIASKSVNSKIDSIIKEEVIRILETESIKDKKEVLSKNFMEWRDQGKMKFPIYYLNKRSCFIPLEEWKMVKGKPLFVPGYFILSCMISIVLGIAIQLILDERVITEPL